MGTGAVGAAQFDDARTGSTAVRARAWGDSCAGSCRDRYSAFAAAIAAIAGIGGEEIFAGGGKRDGAGVLLVASSLAGIFEHSQPGARGMNVTTSRYCRCATTLSFILISSCTCSAPIMTLKGFKPRSVC